MVWADDCLGSSVIQHRVNRKYLKFWHLLKKEQADRGSRVLSELISSRPVYKDLEGYLLYPGHRHLNRTYEDKELGKNAPQIGLQTNLHEVGLSNLLDRN